MSVDVLEPIAGVAGCGVVVVDARKPFWSMGGREREGEGACARLDVFNPGPGPMSSGDGFGREMVVVFADGVRLGIAAKGAATGVTWGEVVIVWAAAAAAMRRGVEELDVLDEPAARGVTAFGASSSLGGVAGGYTYVGTELVVNVEAVGAAERVIEIGRVGVVGAAAAAAAAADEMGVVSGLGAWICPSSISDTG